MELQTIQDRELRQVSTQSPSPFIEANTKEVSLTHLKVDTIIPVFAKDNECTISHWEFIETAQQAIQRVFPNHYVDTPDIRVSHIVKGRIPSAAAKPAKDLLPSERTIYYERLAFLVSLPEIRHTVNGNSLGLTVGGIRALSQENLYSKRTVEKFKVFIGFKNMVCTNLCISTDGFKEEIRVSGTYELFGEMVELFSSYNQKKHLGNMEKMSKYTLSRKQFSHLIGRLKMYQYLSQEEKKQIFPVSFNDGQINSICKGYFGDDNFSCGSEGTINLWDLYNLFTGAVKSSYIDSFLQRECRAYEFSQMLADAMQDNLDNFFLLPGHE